MNRRDALSRVALILGGTVVGANAFLEGCTSSGREAFDTNPVFTPDDIAFLDEVAETIIPATNTPGAKAAKVGTFMTVMVNDCYTEDDQKVFKAGMKKLDEASRQKNGKSFIDSSAAQRKALLTNIDKEANEYAKTAQSDSPKHYFRMMKELTLLGYFTSEPGATQALRYEPVPGKYEGSIKYSKGDRAWAL